MLSFTFTSFFISLVNLSIAGYTLQDGYTAANFFDSFAFFTGGDPTHGFVQYVDRDVAQSSGMIANSSSSIYLGVDHSNIAPNGRTSVRLSSIKSYTHGLFILDLVHMPVGCGTWPAFWSLGPNWPTSGEIDIIEGVNSQSQNQMTLHTSGHCSLSGANSGNTKFSGDMVSSNCTVSNSDNEGCGIKLAVGSNGYGSQLNGIQGGIYATEWTSDGVSIWFFPRSGVPSDISAGHPNPSAWGSPDALFEADCDMNDTFKNHNLVFDTTFCGDWAGNVWGSDSVCASKAATCNSFVANNPSAFTDAYWSINSLNVYQVSVNPSPAAVSSSMALSDFSSAMVSASTQPSETTTATSQTPSPTRTRTRYRSMTTDPIFTGPFVYVANIASSSTLAPPARTSTEGGLLLSWFPSNEGIDGFQGGIPAGVVGNGGRRRHQHAHSHE